MLCSAISSSLLVGRWSTTGLYFGRVECPFVSRGEDPHSEPTNGESEEMENYYRIFYALWRAGVINYIDELALVVLCCFVKGRHQHSPILDEDITRVDETLQGCVLCVRQLVDP